MESLVKKCVLPQLLDVLQKTETPKLKTLNLLSSSDPITRPNIDFYVKLFHQEGLQCWVEKN